MRALKWHAQLLIAVLVALGSDVSADIDVPGRPPPQPVAQTVQVHAGQRVDILLEGRSRSGRQLQFILRSQTKMGSLSKIVTKGLTAAMITYQHDAARGAGIDRFRYAVKAPDTGASAPAEILIRVVEEPPVFRGPRALDFPATPIGRVAERHVEIANDGGGIIEGRIVVPPPWTVDSPSTYRLHSGQSVMLAIRFSPDEPRRFSATGDYMQDPPVKLGLTGQGYVPVEVVPRRVELKSAPGSQVRAAQVFLRNLSDEDRDVVLNLPREVVAPETVRVPAGAEVPVSLRTKDGYLGATEGAIQVTGENVALHVPLTILPAPPELSVEEGASVDFGTVPAGSVRRAQIRIRNTGGLEAAIAVQLPRGVNLVPDPFSLPLPPGAAVEFDAVLEQATPAEINDFITLAVGDATTRIPVNASVQPRGATGVKREAVSSAASPAYAVNAIPPIREIEVIRRAKHELELAWSRPSPRAQDYLLCERRVLFDKRGGAHIELAALKDVIIRSEGERVTARLRGLRAGQTIALRILVIDSAGQYSVPSEAFRLTSLPGSRFQVPVLPLLFVLLALSVYFIIRERRRGGR